jgi:hypothetical protein
LRNTPIEDVLIQRISARYLALGKVLLYAERKEGKFEIMHSGGIGKGSYKVMYVTTGLGTQG